MCHFEYNCSVGQVAQAQREVFETIQQAKSFYFLQLWSLVQLIDKSTPETFLAYQTGGNMLDSRTERLNGNCPSSKDIKTR